MISHIGKYTVEAELGRGGFGQVYKAWVPDVRQSVAIKVLLAQGDSDLLKRFRQEVVTTASLHHKNIVTIYSSGDEDGTPYLVMELLEGQTLGQIIKERIPLSLLEKVRIMTQVAEGLAYAHTKGVVHRDVKPANIMLLRDGSVKIMDFGIALASNRQTASMTLSGFVLGTVPYMSPEQFTSDAKANEQTDIFSFGDVYYELLTGRHPFEPYLRDLGALRVAILTHDPPAVSQLVPHCPEALELLVHRSIAKEREFRYQTFDELRLDSAAVLVDLQHEQAAAILGEVPRLVAAGELQDARAKVREAQKLDPGNRGARQLLEAIDQKLQEKLSQERVTARLLEAERHLSERRYAEAVQTLETAVRLDTGNVLVQMKLVDAKAKLDGAVQANRLVEEARAKQARGELPEALDRLQQALQADPEHTEARRLHPKIAEQLARRQRERIKQEALRKASEYLAGKQFTEALAVLDALEKEQPGGTGVAELRREIERQRAEEERRVRLERFNLALAKTRETIEAGDLERAGRMLAHLAANFASEPGAAEALSLLGERLNALLRARDIALYRQRADDLLDQKSFREASAVLAEALSRYPDDPGLGRQKASADALYEAHRRSQAIAAVLARANSLRDTGDLQGALAAIAEGRRRLGDEAAFIDLVHELEWQLEQQRYSAGLRDLLGGVRALMAAGKPKEAVDRLTRAKDYAREKEVMGLLASARAAAAIDAEREFVARVLADAARFRTQQDRARAAAILEDARSRYPNNPDLLQAVDRLRDEIERERRRESIEKSRTAILREIEAGAWKKAEATVRQARVDFPHESAFRELAERVEDGLWEEALQQAVARIRAKLTANDLPEATRLLEETRPVFAGDRRWQEIEEEIGRRRSYEAALEAAERARREGNLANAEAVLTGMIANAPDPRATRIFRAIQDQRAEDAAAAERVRQALERNDISQATGELHAARAKSRDERLWNKLESEIAARGDLLRRQAAMADIIRECLNRDDIRQATTKLAEARAQYRNDALWAGVEAEIDSRETFLKRQAGIAAIAESVRASSKRGDIGQAVAALQSARKSYPEESLWAALQHEIDAQQALLDRRGQVTSIAESLRRHLEHDDLARAANELLAGRRKLPGEELWNTLEQEIDSRQAALDRRRQVADAVESVRACLRRDDVRQAASELGAARARHPEEPIWATLEAEIDARRQAFERERSLKRQAEIAAIAESVRDSSRRGDIGQAAAALQAARKSHPEESLWAALQQEIDAQQALLDRLGQIASIEESLRRHLEHDDLARASNELMAGRREFPGEELWNTLQQEIDSRLAALDRRKQVAAAAERVRACLGHDDIGQAASELGAARARHPDEAIWATLETEIHARRQAFERERLLRRQAEIAALAERVRDSSQRGDIGQAAAALQAARKSYPGESLWATLQQEIDSQQAALDRRKQVAVAVESVRACLRRDDIGQAASELGAARARHPDEAIWATLETEIQARRQAFERERLLKRQAEIAAAAEGVRACLRRNDIGQAASELSAARARHPDEAIWATLETEIQARQQAFERERLLKRQAEIAALTELVRDFSQRGDIGQAAAALQAARKSYPEESLWATLQQEIDSRQAALDRQKQVAAAAESVRACLGRDDFGQAASVLSAARARHPEETAWATLGAEIDARQQAFERRARVAAAGSTVREHLRRRDIGSAALELERSRAEYPGEELWAKLRDEIAALEAQLDAARKERERVAAIAAAIERAQGLLRAERVDDATAAARAAAAQFPGEPRIAEVLRACEERLRRREVQEIFSRAEALLTQGRPQEAANSIEPRYAAEPLLQELHARIDRELGRERCRTELLSMERRAQSGAGKRQLRELDRAAQRAASLYAADQEISTIAARIHTQVESLLAAPSPKKPVPWKFRIAGIAVAAAAGLLVAGLLWHKPATVATIPFEIRTDPPGATVRLGDRSCETPNCRLDLLPGSYAVTAELKGYAPQRQQVVVDSSRRQFELALEPLPSPPPPLGGASEASGTLVVETGVAGALVYVDGAARSRTNSTGSATLSLEPKTHQLMVERNGYENAAPREVMIASGSRQTVAFKLTLQNARLQLDGAPPGVEIRMAGTPLGRTDGSAAYVFPAPVAPGDQSLEVTLGPAKRTLQQHFESGETAHLEWKSVAPAAPPPPTPNPAEAERQDWERVRATSDAAQLRDFLRAHPSGTNADQAKLRIADLLWGAVDQTNIEAVRQFLRENADNPHRTEGQRIVDQFDARAKQEQAKQEQAKQELARQEQAKQELAKQELDRKAKQEELRRGQILDTLTQLNAAFQRKRPVDVKKIWPGISQTFLDSIGTPRTQISLANEQDIRFAAPDQATVACDLVINNNGARTVQKVTLRLRNNGANWTVLD